MKRSRLYLLGAVLALMGSAQSLGQQSSGQGKLTPDQSEKVHNHLFQKGPAGQIPDMPSKGKGDVYVPCVVPVWQRIQVPFMDELATLASKSDLIVLAKAEAAATHMNAGKDFLYTDWNFVVEEVLKDNPKAPVQPGTAILVARPGGNLQINGRMVHAHCADFEDFAHGQEYLLYLGFVPETGARTRATEAPRLPFPTNPTDWTHSITANRKSAIRTAC